jgi:hypothetical protein
LDLNQTSRASPMMGTIPTKTSKMTLRNCNQLYHCGGQ